MKIQRGIVKYKDRNDIVCTYALTDDGKQYYFLDETDSKKFSNGNRIASTALVEAVDPMAKASNVGVIDQNGAVVIPFENRSIRPVNDNVIVIEKANPTSQSVIEANELRSDPTAAQQLVATPAAIKDRINAQMGTEGKYIFNDQFSEATVCDINGTNLVGGESYSFISTANDKLYLSKNTADSPIQEFSLTTYEMLAPEAINVADAQVDQQVVEDALQASAPTDEFSPADLPAAPADDVVMAFDDEAYALRKTMGEVKEETENNVEQTENDPVMAFDDEAYAARHANEEVTNEVVEENQEEVTTSTDEEVVAPVEEEVTTPEEAAEEPTENVEADLNAFANGVPADEENITEEEVTVPVEETTTEEAAEETTEEVTEDTDEVVAENTDNFVVNYDDESEETEEYEMPPVVEEEEKNDAPVEEEVTTPEEEVTEPVEETTEEAKEETSFSDLVKKVEEEPVQEKGPVNIDAETVLATVDRNNNGIIDSDEIMVPQKGIISKTENQLLSEIYNEPAKVDDPLASLYGTSYGFDPISTDRYDTPAANNNIMADVTKLITELMKQNKEQKGVISQYKGQIESLESQTRLVAEKFKDQSMRYETLASKLRSLDEATGRLEARNQLLEGRVRDQEKIIESQDRELKTLRPQVQGNQDLVRLLADAKSLLGSDNSYGYNDGDSYYRGRAA